MMLMITFLVDVQLYTTLLHDIAVVCAEMPIKDLQSLMTFEYNLQHFRTELLKSFYADLIA